MLRGPQPFRRDGMPLLLVSYLKQRLQVVDHQLTLGVLVGEQEQSLEKALSHDVVTV